MSDFGKLRYAWLDQVVADRTISPLAFKVAYIIACRYLNRQSGDAWPTQETLARAMEVTPRGIRKALSLLVDGGHIEVARARGRGAVNRYRLALNDRNCGSFDEDFEGNHGSSQYNVHRNDSSAQPPESEVLTGTAVPLAEEPQFLQNLYEENHMNKGREDSLIPAISDEDLPSIERPSTQPKKPTKGLPRNPRTSKADTPKALEEEFEGWWRQYPRKVDKGHAKLAYLRVRRSEKVAAADLLAGVLRYSASVAHKEARYIKHGQTWLNGQCWLDEPEPAFHAEPRGYNAVMSGMSAMADEMFGDPAAPCSPGAQIIGLGQARQRRHAEMTGTASAVAGIMSAMGGNHDD